MRMLIRHALSIVILPGSAAVAVPMWILGRTGRPVEWPDDPAHVGLVLCGVLLIGAGAWLFAASLSHFWSRGRGTLAPWDPPRAFVVSGPYRFVRNPMISGVMFVLFGEALVFRSLPLGIWGATFALINFVYIPWVEEPALLARFGEPYARYRNSVPRFVPRPMRRVEF